MNSENTPQWDAGTGLSLRRRVASGGVITLGGFGLGQVLRLVSNLILTRLLAPEAFGLMAVAVAFNVWAIMLADIGIGASVIRSRYSHESFLRTAWTMQVVRDTLLWLVIIGAAIIVYALNSVDVFRADSIYAHPLLPWIMAASGAQIFLNGLASINFTMAQRRLAMGPVVALEIAAQFFMMAITISLAAVGFGVWALVIGMLAGPAAKSAATHILFAGPSMGFCLRREHVLEIFHFGKWLIIASFFGFLVNRGDQILFGGLMQGDRFGVYAIATIWMMSASSALQTVQTRLLYPAFSELLRERPQDLNAAYRKTRLLFDIGAAGLAFGAYFLSEHIFPLLYPDAYSEIGYFIKLLSPMLMLAPLMLINVAVLAAGDSRSFTAVTVFGGVLMLVLTPLIYQQYGEKPAIVFFASINLFAAPLMWRIGSKYLALDVKTEAPALCAMAVLLGLIFWAG